MNIVLNGACGKMGRSIIDLCKRKYKEINIFPVDIKKDEKVYSIEELKTINFDGIIDFSSPEGSFEIIKLALDLKKPIVIGTTGFSDIQIENIKEYSKKIPIFLSPNMSLGVNICFIVADIISKSIDCDIHINETHHKFKKDAPSGTALQFKKIMESNGKKVSISSSRIGDITGEHEIIFALNGEKILLSHTAYNREIFAEGALTALKWLINQQPGFYNFKNIFEVKI
ncbi:MAG: 4-hydroxy-tetrahydrodipicolinate reductase [Elusimicrobiota bacterium]